MVHATPTLAADHLSNTVPVSLTGQAYPRDLFASAIVLSFAAVPWAFWGSSLTPTVGRLFLLLIGVLAVITGVWAVRSSHRVGRSAPTRNDAAGRRSWWTWLAVEVVLIVAGNAVLIHLGQLSLVICWTHLMMGLHFLPLSRTYRMKELVSAGLAASAIALVVAGLHLALSTPTVGWVGGLGAASMVVHAVVIIRQGVRSGDATKGAGVPINDRS